MSYSDELTSVVNHFSINGPTGVQVAYPNVKFDPEGLSEWIRISVLNATAFQSSMGNSINNYRHPGTVIIQVFVEPNSGAKRALELADQISTIWRGQNIDDLVFRAPSIVKIGNIDGWYQVNINCPFYRDELF